MIAHRLWIRTVLVLLAAVTCIQCGGDGGGGDDDPAELVAPLPGRFVGTLGDGAPIRIEVDGIREIAFTCGGTEVHVAFSPPGSIDEHGRFDVAFTDGSRTFDVHGHFTASEVIDGTLADERHECDGSFSAVRVQPPTPAVSPPTPTVTPTPTFTDGPFFPFSPVCTPTPIVVDWPFPPTPPPPFPWPQGT